MRPFTRYLSIVVLAAACVLVAYGAQAQTAPRSDLPESWGQPSEPLPPGAVTLEELDRRRGGGAPAPAEPAASAPAPYSEPAPAEPVAMPSYPPPAPAPAEPVAVPYPPPAPSYPPPASAEPGMGAPAPAPVYGAPRISTLPSPGGQPPASSAGMGSSPTGYSSASTDLPKDYGPPAEPLPPGSITLEDYDARMKAGGAPAASGAAAGTGAMGVPAPAPAPIETTEEVSGDVFGSDEPEDSSDTSKRWDNY